MWMLKLFFVGSTRDGVVGSLGFGSGYKGLTSTAAGSPMGSSLT